MVLFEYEFEYRTCVNTCIAAIDCTDPYGTYMYCSYSNTFVLSQRARFGGVTNSQLVQRSPAEVAVLLVPAVLYCQYEYESYILAVVLGTIRYRYSGGNRAKDNRTRKTKPKGKGRRCSQSLLLLLLRKSRSAPLPALRRHRAQLRPRLQPQD